MCLGVKVTEMATKQSTRSSIWTLGGKLQFQPAKGKPNGKQ